MKRTTKHVIFGVLTCFIIFIFFIVQMARMSTRARDEDPLNFTKKIPKDYVDIFHNNEDLFLKQTIEGKFRNPISQFNYRKNANLFIYKIDDSSNFPLREIIHEEHYNEHISYNYFYNTETNNDTLVINYIAKPIKKRPNIYIYINTYGLDNQTIIKNDTVAYYYSNFNNFSIRYDKSEPQDFFGKVNNKYSPGSLPLEILFLKKNSHIYLIVMTPTNGFAKLRTYELYDLIIKNKR